VRLNGTVRRDPETPVQLFRHCIEVDGQPIVPAQPLYLALNKPRGIVTTASDEAGRDTVYSLLPEGMPWVGPVGRLDKASEGLLLFSNDSEWAARITVPETHLDKTYHVQIESVPDDRLLRRIQNGVPVQGGETLRVKKARFIREGTRRCWVEVVLDEGKNRQIRRIFQSLEIDVSRLVRIAIGPLCLGDLPKGAVRPLTEEEKAALDQALEIA
jgi:23S rRNA pseudouridine2605 synthase